MKRLITSFIFLSITLISTNLWAEGDSSAFKKGAVIFSIGYGFPNLDAQKSNFNNNNFQFESASISEWGPIQGKVEYGIDDRISLGVSANYDHDNVKTTFFYTNGIFHSSFLSILGRMNIHFVKKKKLDVYFGIGVGYRKNNFPIDNTVWYSAVYPIPQDIPLGLEATIGMRYFFMKNIGIYSEVGASKSIIQAGLTIKF